jgi:ribose-phosphate pyrophosphokinase
MPARDHEAMFHVHAFADCAPYGRAVARALGARFNLVRTHIFPDRESLVRVTSPQGRNAVLIRSLDDPNAKLVDTLLAADALRRAGAERVTLAAPYLAYMRQDAVFHAGEAVSQRVIGALLGRAFDAVLTIQPHLHRVDSLAEVVPCEARAIIPASAIARWSRRFKSDCLVVGPDAESRALVLSVAEAAGLKWVVGDKVRLGDRRVRVEFAPLPKASRALVVDDIASSGTTLAATVRSLKRAGILTVDVVVVHAIFAPGALGEIRRAGARRIVSCDTIPHPTNAIKTAVLLARALAEPK